MFRLLQGDVGSGKTIVSLLSIANVIESNYQCAFIAQLKFCLNNTLTLPKNYLKIKYKN